MQSLYRYGMRMNEKENSKWRYSFIHWGDLPTRQELITDHLFSFFGDIKHPSLLNQTGMEEKSVEHLGIDRNTYDRITQRTSSKENKSAHAWMIASDMKWEKSACSTNRIKYVARGACKRWWLTDNLECMAKIYELSIRRIDSDWVKKKCCTYASEGKWKKKPTRWETVAEQWNVCDHEHISVKHIFDCDKMVCPSSVRSFEHLGLDGGAGETTPDDISRPPTSQRECMFVLHLIAFSGISNYQPSLADWFQSTIDTGMN